MDVTTKGGGLNVDKAVAWVKGHKAVVAIVAVVLVLIAYVYPTINSVRDEGITKETQLSASYQDAQNYLSAFISGFYEQVSVLNAQSDVVDEILTDAVKGRYDEGGFSVGSSLFTGIVEAYPEASVQELTRNWARVQDYIQSQRAGFRNVQSRLLDQIRAYDRWRERGIIRHLIVGMYFPSGNLEARVGTTVVTGESALNQMKVIILTDQAREAYETGNMDPLEVPQDEPVTP